MNGRPRPTLRSYRRAAAATVVVILLGGALLAPTVIRFHGLAERGVVVDADVVRIAAPAEGSPRRERNLLVAAFAALWTLPVSLLLFSRSARRDDRRARAGMLS